MNYLTLTYADKDLHSTNPSDHIVRIYNESMVRCETIIQRTTDMEAEFFNLMNEYAIASENRESKKMRIIDRKLAINRDLRHTLYKLRLKYL